MVNANFFFEKLKCHCNKNVAIIHIITANPAKKKKKKKKKTKNKKTSNYVTS